MLFNRLYVDRSVLTLVTVDWGSSVSHLRVAELEQACVGILCTIFVSLEILKIEVMQ